MRKRLLVALLGLIYLAFCCSGYIYSHDEFPENAFHFEHHDSTPDDHHSASPGKSAINAFFLKADLKARQFHSNFHYPVLSAFFGGLQPVSAKYLYSVELADIRSSCLFHRNLLL